MEFGLLRQEVWWANTQLPRAGLVTMVEDVAKTLWLAAQLGEPRALPADEIAKWWDRYHSTYGQASTELGG